MRRRVLLAILLLAAGRFLVLSARWARARGPIELRAPATVVSNSHPAQRALVPYLLFLREVRRRVPAGSTVATIGPDPSETTGIPDPLIAIGQLPANPVVSFPSAADEGQSPPRFVAAYRREFEDPRYRMIAILPYGRLYEIRA
jgi:hypothetical protein